jgi:cytochrome c551/c552
MPSVVNAVPHQVTGRLCRTLAALASLVMATHALAQSGAEIEKAKGCPACHAPTTKKIGPAYAEIAARYRGDAAAAERLVTVLKEGKRHPRIAGSDAELRALVGYILSVR